METMKKPDTLETSAHRHLAIDIRSLDVTFPQPSGPDKKVLQGIDLEVPNGQFVALVGRSGCGKTTLLNVIAGLVNPTGGSTSVLGTTPGAARSRTGFMMARDCLFPWRSARKNVEYGLEIRGVPRRERRQRAERWLEAVHLDHAASSWPWQLSQGMRQRVALARTWALDPEILLMDEPFAALDANTRESVQRQFIDLWQGDEKRTVVFVTHDLGEAIALADRVVLLGDGIVKDDVMVGLDRPRRLDSLWSEPEFTALHNSLRKQLD